MARWQPGTQEVTALKCDPFTPARQPWPQIVRETTRGLNDAKLEPEAHGRCKVSMSRVPLMYS